MSSCKAWARVSVLAKHYCITGWYERAVQRTLGQAETTCIRLHHGTACQCSSGQQEGRWPLGDSEWRTSRMGLPPQGQLSKAAVWQPVTMQRAEAWSCLRGPAAAGAAAAGTAAQVQRLLSQEMGEGCARVLRAAWHGAQGARPHLLRLPAAIRLVRQHRQRTVRGRRRDHQAQLVRRERDAVHRRRVTLRRVHLRTRNNTLKSRRLTPGRSQRRRRPHIALQKAAAR